MNFEAELDAAIRAARSGMDAMRGERGDLRDVFAVVVVARALPRGFPR